MVVDVLSASKCSVSIVKNTCRVHKDTRGRLLWLNLEEKERGRILRGISPPFCMGGRASVLLLWHDL